MLLRGLVTMLALRRCCLFCQMHGRLLATELAGDQDALSSTVRMVSQLPSASSSSKVAFCSRELSARVGAIGTPCCGNCIRCRLRGLLLSRLPAPAAPGGPPSTTGSLRLEEYVARAKDR